MQVRVFKPQADGDYLGVDYQFETVPAVGQELRLDDGTDVTVDKVRYIQDGERFIAAIWLASPKKPPVTIATPGVL